ncbi:MAG: alpha/beta hydrolase [Deltaproteobacteria bacterium]|nr:alpha/beta hydrolase [Deltaproteobacteria bacterium]MDZ4343272.1 alpha/beta hydrolase [Candidatus Binatia bacterium]
MPVAMLDGIETYYETYGSGSPVLMCAPGGFDASIDKWRVASAWTGIDAIKALAAQHTVIVYDRRECGQSHGRVERLSWASYTRQGKALLDYLKVDSAWILGGCMGCSVALAFGVHFPATTRGLVLHWPVGGYRWKVNSQDRFVRHFNFARQNGLKGIIDRARSGNSFWMDPEAGPWASVIARDKEFSERFASQDPERYLGIIATSGRSLFDRDTATGAEPEEVMGIRASALIIPGDDPSHATSGAHCLRELLPKSEFWNVMPPEQTTQKICDRILGFCRVHG